MTPARRAREDAGLSLEDAAKRARVGVAYLARIERHGKASFVLAQRLSHLYGCSIAAFLYSTQPEANGPTNTPTPR